MKSSPKLLLTLCLILLFQFSFSINARVHGLRIRRLLGGSPDMIGQICKQTRPEDMSKCYNILRGDPKILYSKNYFEISTAILELAINKAINGQMFLKELLKTKYSPALNECANTDYAEPVESFKSALVELKVDPLTANYDAKVAGDGPKTCERALLAANIGNPTVSVLNQEISLLSNIAYLATNNL